MYLGYHCITLIAVVFSLLFLSLQANALELPAYSKHYDPGRDPFTDGRNALQLAKKSGRRVLIEVGGDWCSWCHKLNAFLKANPEIQKQLNENFVILKINVSDENDNQKFMQDLPKPLGYPHMYISDTNGNILYSKDTAKFLVNKQYSKPEFIKFINKWKAP